LVLQRGFVTLAQTASMLPVCGRLDLAAKAQAW